MILQPGVPARKIRRENGKAGLKGIKTLLHMQRLTHKEDISAVSHLLVNTGKHLLNRKKEYCLRSLICPTKKHNIFCLLLGSGFGCCKIQLVAILYTVGSTRVMSPIDTHHGVLAVLVALLKLFVLVAILISVLASMLMATQ